MLDIVAVVFSLLFLAVVAIALNSLCIHIIWTSKSLNSKPSSLFLLNLLSIHLIQGLFVFPLYAGKKLKPEDCFWLRFVNNGFRLTYMLTFYGTSIGVLLIAADRFLATYWLNYYKPRVTRLRVKICLIAVWIYIIALCLIPFDTPSYPKHSDTNSSNVATTIATNQTEVFSSKRRCVKYIYIQQDAWVLFMLVVNTALPYVIIILCYVYIIHRLKIMGKKSRPRGQSRAVSSIELIDLKGVPLKLRKEDVDKYKQVTHLTLVLAVAYALFWTPSIIYYPLKSNCRVCFVENYEDSNLEVHVGYITKYLAFLDALAAPLIYCFYHSEFRKSLLRIRSKFLKENAPPRPVQESVNAFTELL